MTAQCAVYVGALKMFETPWLRPRLLFPKFFIGFCSDRPFECSYKIWSPYLYPYVPEIIGGIQKIRAAPGYAHAPFSPKFLWAFIQIGPVNVLAKFEVRSFTRSRDNRGYPKHLDNPWNRPGYAHAPFSAKFLTGFYSEWPCKYIPQIVSP